MKASIHGLFLSLLLLSLSSIAQREYSPEVEAFYAKAMSQINTEYVRWIRSTAREADEKNLTPEEVMSKSRTNGVIASLRDPELDAIISLALILMSKDSKEKLQLLMAQIKALKEQKEKIMAAIAEMDDKKRSITRSHLDSIKLLLKTQPNNQRTNNAPSNRVVTQFEISETRTLLNDQNVSISGLGEELQLRLQLMMDRRNKIITTLSNLMKKISGTQDIIIANLK